LCRNITPGVRVVLFWFADVPQSGCLPLFIYLGKI
jgi:hypothetical protein